MSEQSEQPEQNIEGEQVVVNNAPDGGGVDNNEAEKAPETDTDADSDSEDDSK